LPLASVVAESDSRHSKTPLGESSLLSWCTLTVGWVVLALAESSVIKPVGGVVSQVLLGFYASVLSIYLRTSLNEHSHLISGAMVFAVYSAAVVPSWYSDD
jgi:hypothetical protein